MGLFFLLVFVVDLDDSEAFAAFPSSEHEVASGDEETEELRDSFRCCQGSIW